MSDSRRSLRVIALVACATIAAIVGTGGCSRNTSTTPGPIASPTPVPSGSPTATPSPTPTANVFVSMAYASMSPTIDPVYGQIDGYALISPPPTPVSSPSASPNPSPSPTQTPGASSVVVVSCKTNIQFLNFDTAVFAFHTASMLQPDQGGSGFPKFFDNPNGPTSSPVLTPFSFGNGPNFSFSTGFVFNNQGAPGRSNVYSTGSVNGTYFIGDYTNYNSTPSMRTVIIVKGC
jgi:hypothetical protein